MKYKTILLITLITIITHLFVGCGVSEKPEPIVKKTTPITQDVVVSEEMVQPTKEQEKEEFVEEEISRNNFVIEDINYEVKKLKAELNYANQEIKKLQAKNEIWTNPISIYNKEIILNNGSTIFGKILYQDNTTLKVETLIGALVIERSQIVRIVENLPEEPIIKEIVEENNNEQHNQKILAASESLNQNKNHQLGASIILIGNVKEAKDSSGNTIFSGELQNIGTRRADYVRINFVFRLNWNGDTKTITAYGKGSNHVFESGVFSDTSIFPSALAEFELVVPKEFGTFIGYSYTLDWEEFN
jgi:hypothetical protein